MKRLLLVALMCAVATSAFAQSDEGLPTQTGGFGIAKALADAMYCQLSGCTMSGTLLAPAGSVGSPSIAFAGDTQVGIRLAASAIGSFNAQGGASAAWSGVGLILASNGKLVWTSGVVTGTQDTFLVRDGAANTIAQLNGNNDQKSRIYGPNGAFMERGAATELLTIAAAATTDTTANLLPANAVIDSVVVRVVTVIPTAATFTVGDATTAARFATGISTAANTTAVGLTHSDQTGAAGPKQTSAAKVRITPNATPGTATGQVRITVFYTAFTAPTS
jgi:hypothetical protein